MIGSNYIGRNGRFANQMFQYAALRGIAAKHGYDICMPSGPKTEDEFTDEENQHKLFMAFDLDVQEGAGYIDYRQEKSFTFDQELFDTCPDHVSLYGFFQTEKYFKHIEGEIRKDFTFKESIRKACEESFPFEDAISLHVRRSDYVQKQSYHPLCPLEYYEAALEKLPEDVPVIIFSDDPEWCMKQDLFESDRFNVSETYDNLVDMCLMTMCSFHVVANSSFSWWGAWLADSAKVIAPKVWFGPQANLDDSDLVPEYWERI